MRDAAVTWIWDSSTNAHAKVLWLTVCQTLHGLCGVAYALMLRGVVDAAMMGDAPSFAKWVGATAIVVVMQLAIRAIVRWLDELTRGLLENELKLRLFDVLLRGDVDRVSAVHSGEWLNRLTSDTKVVADGVTEIVPGLAGMVARLLGSLVAILWLDPRLVVVLVPGGAALVAFSLLFRRRLKGLHRGIQEADGHLRTFLQDRLGSLLVVRSFVAEEPSLAEAGHLALAHLDARMRRNRFSNACNVGFGMAMSGARFGAVAWCGYGILTGTMDFGTLTAMAQLVGQVQAPLANISGYLPRWYAMLGSAERLMEAETLMAALPEALPLADVEKYYGRELVAIGLLRVSYAYCPATEDVTVAGKEGMPLAVRDFSVEVHKGEFVAFVGESGCGKSTSLRLQMGAYDPDVGKRYARLADGARVSLDSSLRRLFAYVPQGNQVMGRTVREIVSLGDPGAAHDDDRLWDALRTACADEFVRGLEGELDAPLGERGTGLSEGQTQRLAIARAVFCGSPVLLLDEATSALDAHTEATLLRNLRALENKTVIVVTHRPAALELCDRVITFGEKESIHERA